MSSSSSALKVAAKALERIRVMNSVRPEFVGLFKRTVDDIVSNNRFSKDECVVLQLARGVAKAMGLGEDAVQVKRLHNDRISYEFLHSVKTPMPPPPKKGMPTDPPVTTTTCFIISDKSAFIETYYQKIDENGTNMGGENFVKQFRRPPTPSEDNEDD